MSDMSDDRQEIYPVDEPSEFLLSFIDESQKERDDMEDIWDETERNWLVRPEISAGLRGNTKYPYATDLSTSGLGGAGVGNSRRGWSVLKDPETHQEVMTMASNLILSVFPESDRYIEAWRVGVEDTMSAKTVNALQDYWMRLPGHFLELVQWVLGAGIYGTGIAEAYWDHREESRVFRRIGVDPFTGREFTEEQIARVPVYDDPRFQCFDVRDFFPDHSQTRLDMMNGAARRFRITAAAARDLADRGVYKSTPVETAIVSGASGKADDDEHRHDDESEINPAKEAHAAFREMIGYRYIGRVPYKMADTDPLDTVEIVSINGETVREEIWPRPKPWFDVRFTPRLGSFWGLGPAELIRHGQDFIDTLKMMLADASVKLTHPPHIYNKHADVDLAKLRAYRPAVPIGVQGDPNAAIGQPRYDPQLGPALQTYVGEKQQMREGSSALDANQGLGIGTKRLSASEAVGTFERAAQRPELFIRMMEQEYLPPLARYNLGMFREYIDDSEDLARRVGKSNAMAALADIQPEFDIRFVGSRVRGTKEENLAAFREIMAAAANPMIANLIPWIPLLAMHFEEMGQSEISAMVGNPTMVQMHMMMQMLAAPPGPQAGNGNGTTPSNPSPMTLPAQAQGNALTG